MSDQAQPGVESTETPATEITAEEVLAAATGETPATEAPAEPKVEEPKAPEVQKQDDKFAAKFAALSRREKEIRQREQAAEKKLKDVEARLKQMEDQYAPLRSIDERLKSDPMGLLKERGGLTEKDIIERHILKGEETPEQKQSNVLTALQQKIEQLEARLTKEAEDAKESAKQKEQEKAAKMKEDYLAHLGDFVNKNADDYELIKANDAVSIIFDVMDEAYTNNKKVLTEKEAADAVEAYLLEEATKLMELKKIKGKFAPQKASEPSKITGQSATLSNAAAQQAPNRTERVLSDDQIKAEAAKLIRWTD